MKFTVKDFKLPKNNCDTVKSIVAWAKHNQPFTIEQIKNAFPDVRTLEAQLPEHMRADVLEKYFNSIQGDYLYKIKAYETVIYSQKYQDELEIAKSQLAHQIKTWASVSAPIVIMRELYKNSTRPVTKLNSLLRGTLMNIIESQVMFSENDIAEIFSFGGHYWFGVNANGNGYGESIYTTACLFNTSAAISFEKWAKIEPYILNGHRMFIGTEFELDYVFYRVTGWNKKNELTCVGYENRKSHLNSDSKNRVKRTLRSFDKQQWLAARKEMILITNYSIL